MLEDYIKWYEYSLEALNYEVINARLFNGIKKIVVLGMGGSGIVGDMLASIASTSNYPVYVYKDFYVPRNVIDDSTFVLSISYSGNTLETILSTKKALQYTNAIAIIASGGELLEIAKSNNLPYIIVRGGLAPRAALPIMLIPAFKLLSLCGIKLISNQELLKAVDILRNIDEAEKIGAEILGFIKSSKLPIVVSSLRYAALAIRIKNEFNENSKIPVKVEILPELFHNDIVGWEAAEFKDKAIFIDSDIEHENELINFYADYLRDIGIDIYLLKLKGSIIERFIFGSLIAGIASVKLAQIRGIDPLKTKSITMYKKMLQNIKSLFTL
uniref:Bifunctional phosphoglucose/phosphomannose isomerase n=1 Tax=Ignisphaera aggregans TaxID=334771 RepID=A0A7C5YVX2_9CREN